MNNGNLKLISFIVSKCNNLVKESAPKQKTSLIELKNIKDELAMHYTGAFHAEEANRTLCKLYQEGKIKKRTINR